MRKRKVTITPRLMLAMFNACIALAKGDRRETVGLFATLYVLETEGTHGLTVKEVAARVEALDIRKLSRIMAAQFRKEHPENFCPPNHSLESIVTR